MEKEVNKGKEKQGREIEYLIVERIDTKLLENDMTRTELVSIVKSQKGAFAKNTLPNWSARKTIPPADIALVIADALQCSVRWLITGDDDIQEEYSSEEKMLISKFRNLDEQGKNYVRALLNANSAVADKEPEAIIAVEKKRTAG